MASAPAPTEPGPAEPERPAGRAGASPLPRSLGPSTRAHRVVGAGLQKPGRLAATTRTLARQLGLGLGARETARPAQLRTLSVRFPDGVWAMSQADDRDGSGAGALDPSLAAIVARYQKKKQPRAAPPAQRGLPYALRRRHVTRSGVGTGPTAVANRTRPADARVPRNDGHGPDSFAARPRTRSRHRPSSFDEPGPPVAGSVTRDSSRTTAVATTAPVATHHQTSATMPAGLVHVALAAGIDAGRHADPRDTDPRDTERRSGPLERPNDRLRAAERAAGRPSTSAPAGGSRSTLAASRLRHTARPLTRAGGLRSATLTASSAVLIRMPRTLVERAPTATSSRSGHGRAAPGTPTVPASRQAGAARHSARATAPSPRPPVGAPPPGSSASEWAARLAAAFGPAAAPASAVPSLTTSTVVARHADVAAWPSDAPRRDAAVTAASAADHWDAAASATAGENAMVVARRPFGAPRLRADAMWRSTTAGALARVPSRSWATTLATPEVVTGTVLGELSSRSEVRHRGAGTATDSPTAPRADRVATIRPRAGRRADPTAASGPPSTPAAVATATAARIDRAGRGSSLVRVGSGRAAVSGRGPAVAAAASVASFAARSLRNAQCRLLTRSAHTPGARASGTIAAGTTVLRPFELGSSTPADAWPATATVDRRSATTSGAPAPDPATVSRPRRWDRRAGLARAAGRPFDAVAASVNRPSLLRPAGTTTTGTTTTGTTAAVMGVTGPPPPRGNEHLARTADRWIEPATDPRATASLPVGAPLPQAYRSLATALGNRRPVRVVHGGGAREALRRAGAPAATVGDTILLDRAPSLAPMMRERIAHELVHTAAAGPSPRLFSDPDHDQEERAARRVGRLARQLAPVAIAGAALPAAAPAAAPGTPGTVGSGHLPVSAPARPTALVAPRTPVSPFAEKVAHAAADGVATARSTAGAIAAGASTAGSGTAGSGTAGSGTAGASDGRSTASTAAPPSTAPSRRTRLARSVSGRSAATTASANRSAGRVARAAGLLARRAEPSLQPTIEAPGLATTLNDGTGSTASKGAAADQLQHTTPKRQTATERLDHLDELVAMVEARVLAELERRGGRHRAWM